MDKNTEILEKIARPISAEESELIRQMKDNRFWWCKSSRIALSILYCLEERGMSRQELADKSYVPLEVIESLLHGKDNLNLETISKIEKALGVEIITVNRPYTKTPASRFIIQELELLSKKFSDISIKYAYEDCSQYHVVHIEPHELLEKNEEFVRWCLNFHHRFETLFEKEDLLITERSCTDDMSNLLYYYPSKDINN